MIEILKLIAPVVVSSILLIIGGIKLYNKLHDEMILGKERDIVMQKQIDYNKTECDNVHHRLEESIVESQKTNGRELKEINDKLNIALVSLARTEGYWKGHFEKNENQI